MNSKKHILNELMNRFNIKSIKSHYKYIKEHSDDIDQSILSILNFTNAQLEDYESTVDNMEILNPISEDHEADNIDMEQEDIEIENNMKLEDDNPSENSDVSEEEYEMQLNEENNQYYDFNADDYVEAHYKDEADDSQKDNDIETEGAFTKFNTYYQSLNSNRQQDYNDADETNENNNNYDENDNTDKPINPLMSTQRDPELAKVEKEIVKSDWRLKGEVFSYNRPKDGLVHEKVDFETIKQLDQFDINNFKNNQEQVDQYLNLRDEIEALVKQRIADETYDDVKPKEKTISKLKNRLNDEEFKKLFSKSSHSLTEDIMELKDTNVYNQMTDRDEEVKELKADVIQIFQELSGLLDNLAEGNLTNSLYKGRRTLEAYDRNFFNKDKDFLEAKKIRESSQNLKQKIQYFKDATFNNVDDRMNDALDVELRNTVNDDSKEGKDKLREDGDAENLKRKRRRIKESINKTYHLKKQSQQQKTGLTGQDQSDLNKVSLKFDKTEQKNKSKQVFENINKAKEIDSNKNKGNDYFKGRK